MADTHRSYCCQHTSKEWPNTHAYTYEDTYTKNPKNKKNQGKGKWGKKERGNIKKSGESRRKRQRKGAKKKRQNGDKKEGGGWVYQDRGAWVLRWVGPHTNLARST